MKKTAMVDDILALADKWPSTLVARKDIGDMTGGILNPQTMAILDSRKQGIKIKAHYGRTVFYSVKAVIEHLLEHHTESYDRHKRVS